MKKKQRDHIPSIDEFEDLTLFANESFDTQDVDLFEFTSEESSPLTRLKSIILSLDWEINDEILQELDDELDNLQSMWQNDKVAEVYLQGLSKIGNYIRTKGAYAHPNSIKLLLTFFYNFEKIISSEQITGEQITQLLKGDVRKFKILQYQITQSEIETIPETEVRIQPGGPLETMTTAFAHSDGLKELKAAILSLDWEVTDDSLRQFNDSLAGFHQNMTQNKPALVLVQGLQALGDYIADERVGAHPDAFILLHSFNEALEEILKTDEQGPDQTTIQNLLIDRINRLNNLKLLIASPSGALVDNEHIDEVVMGISSPAVAQKAADPMQQAPGGSFAPAPPTDTVKAPDAASTAGLENEIDTFFGMGAMPAMESAEVQYPDEILSPDAIAPVDDELADDFIEAHLSTKRGLMPALSDSDETSGFAEDMEPVDLPTQNDLADRLDFLFSGTETDNNSALALSALDGNEPLETVDGRTPPVPALADVDQGFDENSIQAALDGVEDTPAQSDFSADTDKNETDPSVLDIQSKLNSFFIDIEEEEPAKTGSTRRTTIADIEQSLFFDQEDIQSALADSDEERGFSEETEAGALDFSPLDEIEEKLDFFFGTESEAVSETGEFQQQTLSSDSLEQSLNLTLRELEAEPAITPALDGFDPKGAGYEPEKPKPEKVQPDETLEGALDLFFTGALEQKNKPATAAVDELTSALEATIDDGRYEQDAESRHIQLAALGALLPVVVRMPSREKVAEANALVTSLKKAGFSAEQLSLVHLLDSVITMLVRLPTRDNAATEKLVNYLYEQLLAEHLRPEALPAAVDRFTAWLQQAGTIMPVVPAASDQEQEPQFAYTAKELYFELSELRSHIREEFAQLRHEMHHHHKP
jgi:pilus assembly protein FimV